MAQAPQIVHSSRLVVALCLVLIPGFIAASLVSYFVSRDSIRNAITNTELPLTSDNVYSEIQKDLISPLQISSMMSRDTFVRDWTLSGERDPDRMTRYLREIMEHYGTFTAFFVSDKTDTYYHAGGILKHVSRDEPRDDWYFRVREKEDPYEINVDIDLANRDALTIFVNYRVFDYQHQFIGATGVGLTVASVAAMIDSYEARYQRTIYFVSPEGKIVLAGQHHPALTSGQGTDIRKIPGLSTVSAAILSGQEGGYEYSIGTDSHYLNARYIPELKWYLIVEKAGSTALINIRNALYVNVAASVAITLTVIWLVTLTLRRYQRRLEEMATTDSLTGLLNRHSLKILLEQTAEESRRSGNPFSLILIDVDHFKKINDRHGHLTGDDVLRSVSSLLKSSLRASDIVARWGGEEFVIILKDTPLRPAVILAEQLCSDLHSTPHATVTGDITLSVSVGVVAFHRSESTESVVARADTLLYQAKKNGRNQVCADSD